MGGQTNPRFLMCTRCRTPARLHADGDPGSGEMIVLAKFDQPVLKS